MTASMKQLYTDAMRAGWLIETGTQATFLVKRNKRTGKIYAGLGIYPDGTAFDVTVRLDAARGMRSYKDMRAVLGI